MNVEELSCQQENEEQRIKLFHVLARLVTSNSKIVCKLCWVSLSCLYYHYTHET